MDPLHIWYRYTFSKLSYQDIYNLFMSSFDFGTLVCCLDPAELSFVASLLVPNRLHVLKPYETTELGITDKLLKLKINNWVSPQMYHFYHNGVARLVVK